MAKKMAYYHILNMDESHIQNVELKKSEDILTLFIQQTVIKVRIVFTFGGIVTGKEHEGGFWGNG